MHFGNWRRLLLSFACAAALVGNPSARAATPKDIQAAIDRGKAYLYSIQKDGNWEVLPRPDPKFTGGWEVENTQYSGMTAIATFALLSAGDDPQDPRLKQAIAFLEKTPTNGVYALGLRCQIWNMVPHDEAVKQAMRRDRDLLIGGILVKPPDTGFYGYNVTKTTEESDHSSSQFAVLGMWALNQAGLEIPSGVWQAFDSAWRSQQLATGAWTYRSAPAGSTDDPNRQPTISMTAAGVATLFITQDYTRMAPHTDGNIDDPSIDQGLKWLGEHLHDMGQDREYYTLFGINRVGLACGYKYIGDTDWFTWGSDLILKAQHPEGYWASLRENPNNVPDTSFALLFLSRGRAPIMMNKLHYDVVTPAKKTVPGTWNQRPRDVANITRMIGRQIESQLNWQVVTLRQKSQDLHEAPILYLSGSAAPRLSTEDQNTLREFVEDGGLVFGQADGNSIAFSEGFRKLGEAMFPGRTFRPLPAEHPIYAAENFPRTSWPIKPALEGLTNGDRELMLLLPTGDPAKIWQSQAFPNIKKDVYGQMMIDILLYATDQQGLRERGDTYVLNRSDAIHAAKTLKIARLQYPGNWNPEPGGWRRLAIAMHNDRAIDLDIHPADTGPGLDKSFTAAHLAVLGEISLSDQARKAIADYVNAGGTLVVDVPGGAGVDRTNAETEIAKIFPDAPRPLPVLPLDHPLYQSGSSIKIAAYRHYARSIIGNIRVPRLRGWIRNGRLAVIYSPDDISVGLVGQQLGGIVGYTPESATALMENILQYAGSH